MFRREAECGFASSSKCGRIVKQLESLLHGQGCICNAQCGFACDGQFRGFGEVEGMRADQYRLALRAGLDQIVCAERKQAAH